MPDIINRLDPEDPESIKRASTRKRILALTSLCVVVIGVRWFFKNPPPPQAPDHAQHAFRAIPGVLKNLPEPERKKLTPQQLAMLEEADRKALQLPGSGEALVKKIYKPVEAPVQIVNEMKTEAKKFEYAQRRKAPREIPTPESVDLSKDTLVLFVKGGYIKAEDALRINGSVQIEIDRNMHARVPQKIVRLITGNAAAWIEPIPRGFTQLKPAKGITVVLSSEIANRITLPSKSPNEI